MTIFRNQVFQLAPETTPGTPATLSGADCIPVGMFTPTALEATRIERERLRGLYGKSAPDLIAHKRTGFPNIPFDFAGSGTPGVAPPIGRFFRAMGFAEVVTSTTVTYTLANTSAEATQRWTAACGISGHRRMATGALATEMTITGEVDSAMRGQVSILGTYVEPTDTANATSTATNLAYPVVFGPNILPGSVSIQGYTGACLNSFSLAIANNTPSHASANCQQRVEHTNRRLTGTVVIARPAIAAFNAAQRVTDSVVGSLSLPMNGGTGNNALITLPKIAFTTFEDTNIDELHYLTLNYDGIIEGPADYPVFTFA
jgi:hypothetical protein